MPEPSEEAPEQVLELARACEEYVERALGFRLDYSVETLPVLDQYAEGVRESVEDRPDLLPLLSHAVGAYFGEVVRRKFGGFWRLPSSNVVDWQVCLTHVFLWFNPIGVACDGIVGHAEHGGPGSQLKVAAEDRDLVKNRLGQLADVTEDEYYMLSTRAEVVEIVVDELTRHMEASGYAESTFDESDYEAEQRLPL